MLKAVVLDANAVARNLLSSVLTTGGHEVIAGMGLGAANLARVIHLKPQIICIDIGEANDEGLTVLENLRSELPKSLLFLVSAKIDAATIQAAQQRGVHGFIVKPFNSVAVLSSIRNSIIRIAKQSRPANPETTTEPGTPDAGETSAPVSQ